MGKRTCIYLFILFFLNLHVYIRDGICLEMPFSIDCPPLTEITTFILLRFFVPQVSGFLPTSAVHQRPSPFGCWPACECKYFLLQILLKMRRSLRNHMENKQRGKKITRNALLVLKQAFWYLRPAVTSLWCLLQQVSELSKEGQSLSPCIQWFRPPLFPQFLYTALSEAQKI